MNFLYIIQIFLSRLLKNLRGSYSKFSPFQMDQIEIVECEKLWMLRDNCDNQLELKLIDMKIEGFLLHFLDKNGGKQLSQENQMIGGFLGEE